MGSLMIWNAAAAEAAADKCRKERREKRDMGSLRKGVYQVQELLTTGNTGERGTKSSL
jgi:hypothetical protein